MLIQFHNLQALDEKRYINLDAKLLKLFGPMAQDGRIYFPNIPEMMNRFLEPAEPIVLNYVVKVDKSSSTLPPQYYDIDLSLDHPIRNRMNNIVNANAPNIASQPTSAAAQVVQYDDQISTIIAQLKLNCEKARFLRGFSEQPTAVMKRWVDQQQRSLDQIVANEEVDEDSEGESEEEVLEELDDDEFAKTIAGLQTSLSRQRGKKKWSGPEVDEAVGLFLAQPLESGGVSGQTRPR
jgi:SWI/SNF-related matrix-associated actin-dependent regulator of chromatin subfamily D